jgi:hypothetical protein
VKTTLPEKTLAKLSAQEAYDADPAAAVIVPVAFWSITTVLIWHARKIV